MSKTLRSEIDRLARSMMEGFADPESLMPSKVEAIITYIEERLYPVADRINETSTRRRYLEDIDRIQYAAEQFLEAYDSDNHAWTQHLAEAHKTLAGVSTLAGKAKLGQIVSEEITESRVRKTMRQLVEAPEVLPGDVQKLANDSVDVGLDSYFKKAADTLDMTGGANKERAQDGGDGTQNFSPVDFASDVATLVDRANALLDLDGTIARRAYNYVSQNHGPDAAENFKQVLEANFDIFMESQPDMEGERNAMRPAAVGAGAGSGGEAASGGGGGEGGAP